MKFLILNGPNINLARWSEPGVPGEVDYNGLMDYVQAGCDQLGAVEVMLDAPDEREPFRKTDVVSFGCQGHFIGEGPQGYLHACIWLAQLLRTDGSSKAHIVM